MDRCQDRNLREHRQGRAGRIHRADCRRPRRPADQGLIMASAVIDGITTRYDVIGSGPPLLMYAPGGFNAVVEAWSTLGSYARIKLLDHLPKRFTCILFDRRECGQSGGRVERVTWQHFVAQGKGLLDHLGIKRAHLMGGCMGCPPVTAFAVAYPDMVSSMVLYWPVGGAKYRISSHQRFAEHLAFVSSDGLDGVVALVAKDGKPFGADPRGGPWAARCSTATLRPVPSRRISCAWIFQRSSFRAMMRRTRRPRRAILRNACRGRSVGLCRSSGRTRTRPTLAFWSF